MGPGYFHTVNVLKSWCNNIGCKFSRLAIDIFYKLNCGVRVKDKLIPSHVFLFYAVYTLYLALKGSYESTALGCTVL